MLINPELLRDEQLLADEDFANLPEFPLDYVDFERAIALGYRGLAITDECSLAGVVRAHGEAKRLGLHLGLGLAAFHDLLTQIDLDRLAEGQRRQVHARLSRLLNRCEVPHA